MPADALSLLPLTAAQAEALEALPEMLELVRRLVPGGERPISAHAAARLAKRRTGTVLEALRGGELPGRFHEGTHGGRGHWDVLPSDVVRWVRNA